MTKWLFLIDPLKTLNHSTDTTLPIIREAYNRKIITHYATLKDLFFDKNVKVKAKEINNKYKSKRYQTINLDNFDLIFMRKEPPYDFAFHYATELLSLTKTPVVNSPRALRNYNEKLIILNFPNIIPNTLVTKNKFLAFDFVKKHKECVIKALDSYQGKVVARTNLENIKTLFTKFSIKGNIQIMLQKFLPQVSKGDKRVLILGNKVLGAVNRMPNKGSFLSNFGQGGRGFKAHLSKKEQLICKKVIPFLTKNHIYFAGLDLIGEKLTEINITCPTGLQHINRLNKVSLEKKVVDFFLKEKVL